MNNKLSFILVNSIKRRYKIYAKVIEEEQLPIVGQKREFVDYYYEVVRVENITHKLYKNQHNKGVYKIYYVEKNGYIMADEDPIGDGTVGIYYAVEVKK